MSIEKAKKLNPLLSNWPTGVVYTASWLNSQGISYPLTQKYRESNWIQPVGRGAFTKLGDKVDWKGGLWAIQEQLKLPIHVGGKTALSMCGYSHFLNFGTELVTLFGTPNIKLPLWFKQYNQNINLEYFSTNLFDKSPEIGLTKKDFGTFSLTISTPERAIMEVLYLVPLKQSFEEARLLMEGLISLRPNLVQKLLENCNSVKVKRLFMYMAETFNYPWVIRLKPDLIDLGAGKRVIVKGGYLDPKYQITVPFIDAENE